MAVLILAAGQGTRMKSNKAKVLHELCGRPMICRVVEAAMPLSPARLVAVVGHQAEEVMKAFEREMPGANIRYAIQKVRLGTGHAVLATAEALAGFSGDVLILSGDVPLLRTATLKTFLGSHAASGAGLSVLTFRAPNPAGYGRILRGPGGELLANIEQRDATPEQLAIDEVNSGIYAAGKELLFRLLARVGCANDQKEYYLTDIIALAVADKIPCRAEILADPTEVQGINTLEELTRAEDILRRRGV